MAKINSRISLLRSYAMNDKKINFDRLQQLNDEELKSWWRAVPGARHFLNAIIEATDKHCATAAHLPKNEVEGFLKILIEKIRRRHVSLMVEIFEYKGKGDLEDFTAELTERFAPNFLRDFTKDSPLTDLAEQNLLNGYAIIVKLQNKFTSLTSAVSDFNKGNSELSGSIIFVTSEENPPPSIVRLSDSLTPYDVQFFAINLLDDAKLSAQEKLYTATLAAKLAGQSAILAKNLATAELFTNGAEFVEKIIPNFDGRIFSKAVWECQVQFLLPTLEQVRGRLIEKNFHRLKSILPVKDEFGKLISDPWDMELRHLHYYGGSELLFHISDWEVLEFAYRARNEISHLEVLECARIEKIFTLAE